MPPPRRPPIVALQYDDDAYVETLRRLPGAPADAPLGLMGRQVAGRSFLDAYLSHGRWETLVALVRKRPRADALVAFCRDHPSSLTRVRRLSVVEESRFHASFFPSPPASLIHTPCPPDPRYAWARQHAGPHAYALSGVTHTLASAGAVALLCGLVTAPYEEYDALICTSRAVAAFVRAVTSTYCDYLRDRLGGNPRLPVRLETIPLGVDTDLYRPPAPAERAAQRAALGVAEDELVVLFVGRLSHHAKAHPYPMFRALDAAARSTGKKVRLILAGWTANAAVRHAFLEGARLFAPGVHVTLVDGADPATRFNIWRAADLFTSLSDNIQETFGLVVVEAMACGLPVVATDWNGYRDLVVDGESGCLVPTRVVPGANADATSRLLFGEIDYDHFLAEHSQSVAVDVPAAALAYARLLEDAPLRQRMGVAARQRALQHFTWASVVRAYESLWQSQDDQRSLLASQPRRAIITPSLYPDPDHAFAAYPTAPLPDDALLIASSDASNLLPSLLASPLTNHSPDRRVSDPSLITSLLIAASTPTPLHQLLPLLDAPSAQSRATLAWLLKYDLLRPATP